MIKEFIETNVRINLEAVIGHSMLLSHCGFYPLQKQPAQNPLSAAKMPFNIDLSVSESANLVSEMACL